MNAQRNEKGQALVLIILAIFGIFGFAALGVDVGHIYSERRTAQNAADSAALAAAFVVTQNQSATQAEIEQAGLDSAVLNGFDNNGSTNTVTINNPPVSGPYTGNWDYFQVIVWSHINPIFAQFVYQGAEEVTTEAVTYARSISAYSAGNAIHSLDTSPDSMVWDGSINVLVNGGNIYSNGGLTKNGSTPHKIIEVTNGEIFSHLSWVHHGNPTVIPDPDDTDNPVLKVEDLPTPYCPTHNETVTDADGNVVHYYYHTGLTSSATLQPGIHCFYGNVKLAGGDHVTGNNVLIVMMSGGWEMKGNSSLDIHSDNDIIDKNGHQYGGLLFYAPKTNTNQFDLGGNSDTYLWGTVLAPGATCDVGGNPTGTAHHSALICSKIRFHGSAEVSIEYYANEQIRMPPAIALMQ